MTDTTEADIRHIYERWHATVRGRDIDGLTALYTRTPSWRARWSSPSRAAAPPGS